MKFFKHFVDAHRGTLMSTLMDEMEHRGVACYWILVEMCAEKLEKGDEELFTDEHCYFRFPEKKVRQNLRVSAANLARFLDICAANVALSWELVGNVLEIRMPKLLECMDRDSKRARQARAMPAPKKKRKIEEKEEDKDKEATVVSIARISDAQKLENRYKFDFAALFSRYPRVQKQAISFSIMASNIADVATYDEVGRACDNYRAHCEREGIDFGYILTFPKWWEEWRDWLDSTTGTSKIQLSRKLDLSDIPWNGPDGAVS